MQSRRHRRRRFEVLAPILCVALAGCAHLPIPWFSHTADDWHEYTSEHFLVDTDASGEVARGLVATLEVTHALLVKAIFGEGQEVSGRVRVLALHDQTLFRTLAGDDRFAGYYGRGLLGEPTIVLRVEGRGVDGETVAHELAHRLSFIAVPRQPRWYSEGFAIYVQTVAIEGPGGGLVGAATPKMREQLRTLPELPLDHVLRWSAPGDPGGFHVWSWLLYHDLADRHGAELEAYRRALTAGEDPDVAWRGAFPDFDPGRPGALARLEAELAEYRSAGAFASRPVTATAKVAVAERPLDATDVRWLLLAMKASWPDAPTREATLRAEAQRALKLDPTHPVALAARAEVEGTSPVEPLRAAVAAHPRDWRAWLLLGAALNEPSQRRARIEAYYKAVALNQDCPQALSGLAWALTNEGRGREALPFARRAVALAPFDPDALESLAFVEVETGDCSEALDVQRRAVAMAGPESSQKARARLEAYKDECKDPDMTLAAPPYSRRRVAGAQQPQ